MGGSGLCSHLRSDEPRGLGKPGWVGINYTGKRRLEQQCPLLVPSG